MPQYLKKNLKNFVKNNIIYGLAYSLLFGWTL